MNKYIILFLFTVLGINAQNRSDIIREKLIARDYSSVLVTSHRGDWRNFPENSLEAIESAIKMGVDIVELDVQKTKDGTLILMHDETLNRTTTGKGKISDVDIDYISDLRLRNGCAIKTICKVPTLEEALVLAKGKVMINIDKGDKYFDEVYKLSLKTGTTNQIIMKGNEAPEVVKRLFGKYLNEIIYMPIVNLDNANAEAQIRSFCNELNPVAFELLFEDDKNKLPLKIKTELKDKSFIWYNTLWNTMAGGHDDDMSLKDPDSGYGYLINELGARIIQTDRPAMLLEYLRKLGLHD